VNMNERDNQILDTLTVARRLGIKIPNPLTEADYEILLTQTEDRLFPPAEAEVSPQADWLIYQETDPLELAKLVLGACNEEFEHRSADDLLEARDYLEQYRFAYDEEMPCRTISDAVKRIDEELDRR
jgi:hypothetical protein